MVSGCWARPRPAGRAGTWCREFHSRVSSPVHGDEEEIHPNDVSCSRAIFYVDLMLAEAAPHQVLGARAGCDSWRDPPLLLLTKCVSPQRPKAVMRSESR